MKICHMNQPFGNLLLGKHQVYDCALHIYYCWLTQYRKIIVYVQFLIIYNISPLAWKLPSTFLSSRRKSLPKPFKYLACLMRRLTWVTISTNYHNCVLWIKCHIAALGANAGFCLVKETGCIDSLGQSATQSALWYSHVPFSPIWTTTALPFLSIK